MKKEYEQAQREGREDQYGSVEYHHDNNHEGERKEMKEEKKGIVARLLGKLKK